MIFKIRTTIAYIHNQIVSTVSVLCYTIIDGTTLPYTSAVANPRFDSQSSALLLPLPLPLTLPGSCSTVPASQHTLSTL